MISAETDFEPAANGPFEGPEKLLEIWFAPSAADCLDATSSTDGKFGLRRVHRVVWEEMLDIVKCKILSVVEGTETDAYLLRCVPSVTHDRLWLCIPSPAILPIECIINETPVARYE